VAAILVNTRLAAFGAQRLIRTIDNHKNVKKILTVTFTIDRAVNHLNAGCATLKDGLTWYCIVPIIRSKCRSAFSGRSDQTNVRCSRSDQPVELEGPLRPIGEYNVLCRKIVSLRNIKSAARVGEYTLLESSTQCRSHVGLVVCFCAVLEDVADLRLLRERSCRTH
jgi:N-dimethylarginine dimethylaminohydrolase